jgi:hypothetical protein
MRARLSTEKSANPLDATMTKTQVVRRKFKSGLPRRIEDRQLSAMEAMARTMELFDRLRTMMEDEGLNPDAARAALTFYQPQTKGKQHIAAQTIVLPKPEDIGTFVEKVMALHKPHFLGVMFLQQDPDTENPDQKNVIFAWPFVAGSEAQGRLIAARDQMAKGGEKKVAN